MIFSEISPLEWVANLINLLAVWLAAYQLRWTWILGLIGPLLYAWMFWDAQLYADVTLQFFYFFSAMVGWKIWTEKQTIAPESVHTSQLLAYGCLALILGGVYGYLLSSTTSASYPYIDSQILTLSIVGQILMVRKQSACWIFWLIVNTMAVPLYAVKGLLLTALIYGVFWLSSLWGLKNWIHKR